MDCKKALSETNGNEDEAIKLLRKKGKATAAKKAGRAASEGLIEQYIHLGGKVGVLLEINCETDFVAKTDDFKQLARDICMHIAAASPVAVRRDDVSADLIAAEKEIVVAQVTGKPEHIVEKIVDGRLTKYFQTVALLEQPFVKNPSQSIQDLLTEKVAKLGENIVISRFARFQIGA